MTTEKVENLTTQDQNWMMMTILQIPWSECNKISDEEDRKFLLNKAEEALRHLQFQQQMKQEQEQEQEQSAPSCQPQQ